MCAHTPACLYVHHGRAGAQADQKLELKVHMVVNHVIWRRELNPVPLEEQQILVTDEPPLQHW